MNILRARARDDRGFTMIEAIVIVFIVGILLAITVPSMTAQKSRAANAAVKGDLRNLAVAAKAYYTEYFAYPSDAKGFAFKDAGVDGLPTTSPETAYRAFTITSGAKAGFVIYGASQATSKVFVVSSWEEQKPHEIALTALPETPPVAGTLGVPTGVTASSWAKIEGASWGVSALRTDADPAASRVPIADPTFAAAVRTVPDSAPLGNVMSYPPSTGPTLQVVADASPVASNAIEVVRQSTGTLQGAYVLAQASAASWPASVPKLALNDTWTVSAYVKAPAGTVLNFGGRVVNSFGTGVTGYQYKSVTTTGSWQRVSHTITVTNGADVGSYMSVYVLSPATALAGTSYRVTAPQINRGTAATPFAIQPV